MNDREKATQLQDFITSLVQIKEIDKVHELINDFTAGKFDDIPDVKTAISVRKMTQLETEKKILQAKVEALEKKINEVSETTKSAEKNNSRLEIVVEEQHKTIINLTKAIAGVQMEFKEYREVLGRRKPPKLGAESLAAIRNALVSDGSSKEIKGFLAFLNSTEDLERRYQLKQRDHVVPDLLKLDNHILANQMTPAVQAIKDSIRTHAKFESGQDFVVVDENTIFKSIPKPSTQQKAAEPLKDEVKLTIGRKGLEGLFSKQ